MKALIALLILAVAALMLGLFKTRKAVLPVVVIGLAAVLGMTMLYGCTCENSFYRSIFDEAKYGNMFDMLRFNNFGAAMSGVMIASTLAIVLLSVKGFAYENHHLAELYALLLFTLCGAIIMVSYTHMVMLFLGIEIMSIPLYILAGSRKKDIQSNEAALKYFLMGAFATGILLFGIALTYGASGSFDIDGLIVYTRTGHTSTMFSVGMAMVLIGMAFKIGAAPFHFWTPDVYSGSPAIVTSFMATVVKTAGFGATYILFNNVYGVQSGWPNTFAWIAVATMFLGNLIATAQTGFKRMMAYSSIAHSGYLLMAVVTGNANAPSAILLYLAAYSVATIAAFAILIIIKQGNEGNDSFAHFNGLGKTHPFPAIVLTLSMLSLAGIPITAGFFSKYFLFATVWGDYHWLVILAIINSAISIYYYLRVVIAAWFNQPAAGQESLQFPLLYKLVMAVCAIGIVFLGIFPESVINLVK